MLKTSHRCVRSTGLSLLSKAGLPLAFAVWGDVDNWGYTVRMAEPPMPGKLSHFSYKGHSRAVQCHCQA